MNQKIAQSVQQALIEDIGSGDVTSQLIDETQTASAKIINREALVLCGVDYVNEVFKQVDSDVKLDWYFKDAEVITKEETLCKIEGKARSLLTAERTALNFLQTLSGTATYTYRLNQFLKNTHCKLLDTRKTIPGLRVAQKYAVTCGGGLNHRMGLYDAFLIKENHIKAAGSIAHAAAQARQINPNILLEVEVENLAELVEALEVQVPRILLDNFSLSDLKKAVAITKGKAQLEASGNVSKANIQAIAQTGVDFISVGKLTKDVQAVDLSMLFIG